MSDVMSTIEAKQHAANVENAAKPKRNRAKAPTIEHSAAIVAYAKAKNIDETRAGKQLRAVLRANADAYQKNGGKRHEKNSPWPAHPRKAMKVLFPSIKTLH
jgi:hypothetical protein